jgi:hypothetical protein
MLPCSNPMIPPIGSSCCIRERIGPSAVEWSYLVPYIPRKLQFRPKISIKFLNIRNKDWLVIKRILTRNSNKFLLLWLAPGNWKSETSSPEGGIYPNDIAHSRRREISLPHTHTHTHWADIWQSRIFPVLFSKLSKLHKKVTRKNCMCAWLY